MEIFKRWIRSLFGSSRSLKVKSKKKVGKTAKKRALKSLKLGKIRKKAAVNKDIPKKANRTKSVKNVKKVFKKKSTKKVAVRTDLAEIKLGVVTHFFPKVNAAVIKLEKPLSVGSVVRFRGADEFDQVVESMQINRQPIESAKKNDEIGIQVNKPVREGDVAFLIKGDSHG